MKLPILFTSFLALSAAAAAQTTLVANTSNNNGLTSGMPGLFFDFTAGANDLTVTELSTASNRAPGETFDIEVWTFAGSGLGGPVSSGPGSSPTGWTSLGVATATQGLVQNGTSLPIDIPDIVVPAGQTVGVALVYLGGGSRYFGQGSTPPQVFSDANLTLTTGNSRSQPFTTSGSFFESRGLHGEVTYVLGAGGTLGSNYCTAQPNSTGGPASISASGSATAADNDLTLNAAGVPPMQFGIFLTSTTQAMTPVASGTLCLGGNIIRFQGPSQILQADANGEYSLQIDTTALPAGVPTPIMAGDTYSFTTWFRDVDPMTGNTANFSDGVEITFD